MSISTRTKAVLVLGLVVNLLFIAACSQDRVALMDNNKNAIVLAAGNISESITQLERIERYSKPRIVSVKDENMQQYNLGARVTVDWSGPIEPLMQEVANYSGYRLKVLGIAPAIPILVNVSNENIEIGDVVRVAHLQAQERANVVIYPKSKVLEVRYNEVG